MLFFAQYISLFNHLKNIYIYLSIHIMHFICTISYFLFILFKISDENYDASFWRNALSLKEKNILR